MEMHSARVTRSYCLPAPTTLRFFSYPSIVHRRVYDALNVLEALDIISKEKKEVKWKGFPETQSAHQFALQRLQEQARQVEQKEMKLRALVGQFVAFKQVIARNRERAGALPRDMVAERPDPVQPSGANGGGAGGGATPPPQSRIHMPFLLVQTQTPSSIDCEMADDRQNAIFTFQHPFSVHDDSEILRGLGLQSPAAAADLAQMGLPKEMQRFAQGESARAVRVEVPKATSGTAAAGGAAAAAGAAGAATTAQPAPPPTPALGSMAVPSLGLPAQVTGPLAGTAVSQSRTFADPAAATAQALS